MRDRPTLYGAAYSVYVRIARLAFEEKGVGYDLEPVDIFAEAGVPEDYRRLHPFGKIPALRHGGFTLYETDAIVRYVDDAFDGPSLTPAGAEARARMAQIMRVMDNYAYPSLVWGIYVGEAGERPDPDKLAASVDPAAHCLTVLESLLSGPFMLGDRVTLADLHSAPMIAYLRIAPTGHRLLARRPHLAAWFDRMANRASMKRTLFPRESPEG
jgi:glutathione S-transferase